MYPDIDKLTPCLAQSGTASGGPQKGLKRPKSTEKEKSVPKLKLLEIFFQDFSFLTEPNRGTLYFIIVNVLRASKKKNLERISLITTVLGQIFLLFG